MMGTREESYEELTSNLKRLATVSHKATARNAALGEWVSTACERLREEIAAIRRCAEPNRKIVHSRNG